MSTRTASRRATSHGPRRARIRRASPRLAPVRAAAALALLAAGAAIYGTVSSPAFALRTIEIDGLKYVAKQSVSDLLALSSVAPNLVGLRTDALVERIEGLPGVTAASVSIALPDTLRVDVEEREPILVWAWNGHRFLVDRDGRIFADTTAPGTTTAARAAAARLPVIEDRRAHPGAGSLPDAEEPTEPEPEDSASPDGTEVPADATEEPDPDAEPSDDPTVEPDPDATGEPDPDASSAPDPSAGPDAEGGTPAEPAPARGPAFLAIGRSIDPFVFDAATRIASLIPAQVGSDADHLVVILDDIDGFSVVTGADGWQAVFGFYSASIRSPELIPGQVRLLRSLLTGREAKIARIVLADDRNGTYTAR